MSGHTDALLAARLARATAAVASVRDVVDGRVAADAPPPWCASRGWTDFLVSLSDTELERCETEGLGARARAIPGAPASLVELAQEIAVAIRLPTLIAGDGPTGTVPDALLRSVPKRKRAQLEALLASARSMMSGCGRIVDVGAGRGHLARLASTMLDRAAVGLEREPSRVRSAEELAARDGGTGATFRAFDAFEETLDLEARDLVVGLHACGEVADVMLSAAARARSAVALVSCCLQKVRGEIRAPLSERGREAGLAIRREALGLTNLAPRERGVETTTLATMRARQTRFALRLLLARRGHDVAPGEEMRGINRRRARAGLDDLARRALEARGLATAGADELAACKEEAARRFGIVRRLSLPRSMVGRLLEVAIVLDRAAFLEEQGYDVRVGTLFEDAVSPRNLAILGDPGMVGPR